LCDISDFDLISGAYKIAQAKISFFVSFLDPNHALCPDKRDACGLYARRQGGKTCITLQQLDLFHGFPKGNVAALRGPSSLDSKAGDEKVPATKGSVPHNHTLISFSTRAPFPQPLTASSKTVAGPSAIPTARHIVNRRMYYHFLRIQPEERV
jgi:hypothetical protein